MPEYPLQQAKMNRRPETAGPDQIVGNRSCWSCLAKTPGKANGRPINSIAINTKINSKIIAYMFSLDLLQAINDWQKGYGTEKKLSRGQKIKEVVSGLDEEFRSCDLCCFRQISLDKKSVWNIIADNRLDEMISSWSLDLSVSKNHKGGVPSEDWQGAIFTLKPEPAQVILNLDRLYRNSAFLEAVETHKHMISYFSLGIGKYGNSQSEVIIEIESLENLNLYALGGYSSSKENLLSRLLGRLPTEEELEIVDLDLRRLGRSIGPAWIEGDQVAQIRQKMQPEIERLKHIKNLQKT